jgi:hypothetical protein
MAVASLSEGSFSFGPVVVIRSDSLGIARSASERSFLMGNLGMVIGFVAVGCPDGYLAVAVSVAGDRVWRGGIWSGAYFRETQSII